MQLAELAGACEVIRPTARSDEGPTGKRIRRDASGWRAVNRSGDLTQFGSHEGSEALRDLMRRASGQAGSVAGRVIAGQVFVRMGSGPQWG